MSNARTSVEVQTTGPSYLGWRGELLAELALARVPGLIVHKRPEQETADLPYAFLVATEDGFCFFVEVRAFSSARLGIKDVQTVGELRWSIDAELIRRARESCNPVVLFLFDADTDHGRYVRLDSLPDPGPHAHHVTVRLPADHTTDRKSVEKLVAALQEAASR